MDRIRAPVRCFLNDIPSTIRNESSLLETERLQLRIIGSIKSTNDDNSTIALDDGTALASGIRVTTAMMELVSTGTTVECIVTVRGDETDGFLLEADQLAVVPNDMETLRWFEIAHQFHREQHGHNNTETWRGYPQYQTTPEDVYLVIRGASPGETQKNGKQTGGGIGLEDLAACFNLDPNQVLRLVEFLQGKGCIYQNEHGRYVPM